MKASELRIGNYMDIGKDIMPVELADFSDAFDNGEDWFDNLFKPIPLTEEWLVKFGFEKKDSFSDYERVSEKIQFHIGTPNIGRVVIIEKGSDILRGISLTYKNFSVHQLQNLYFALTGEELILERKQLNSK